MELRCRRPLLLTSLIVGAAFSLLAAGCGGGGTPRVASVTSSTTAVTTPANGVVAYSRCMRSHGVSTFPDPDSSGQLEKPQVISARSADPSRFDTADNACGHFLPNGPGGAPPIPRADRVDYLKAAACMRRHGIPGFPDPTFPDNSVKFNIPSSINPNSPQVVNALPICRKLIPAGLPYSGTN
jgi:hypothetical protein